MGLWDYIILAAVALGLFWAIFASVRRARRGGGCCGDCMKCHGECRRDRRK